MTARSLLNSMSMRNMRRVVGHNKKLMIIICILQALGIPLIAGVLMLEMIRSSMIVDTEEINSIIYAMLSGITLYSGIGVTCLGAAVLSGIIAAIASYQELWKKSKVDMLYALPLTGKQRFFSHYFGGAVVYLLPYIVAVLLGWIIVLSLSIPVNFDALEISRTTFLTEFAKYYTLGSIGLGLLMWLYYTSTVLIITCCGTLFESIYTTLLLNALLPGTLAAVIGVICANVDGLGFLHTWHSIGYTSPLGGLIYLIYILSGATVPSMDRNTAYASEALGHGMIPSFIRWALVLFVIITLLLILSWQLYQRRLAESVSKPFIYIGAYYFLLTLVTVCILCMTEVGVLGAAILFSAIVYFVMEVIRKRGFRKFWLTAITYVATVVVTLSSFALVGVTNGFGRAYYIPPASTVSSMQITLPSYPDNMDLTLEYTNKDVIRAVQEVQKDIVSDWKADGDSTSAINRRLQDEGYMILSYGYRDGSSYGEDYYLTDPQEYNDYYYDDYYSYFDMDVPVDDPEDWVYSYASDRFVEITYYTYTGSEVHREYYVNFDQYVGLLNAVRGTSLYNQACTEQFEYAITNQVEEYQSDESGGYRYVIPDRVQLSLAATRYGYGKEFYALGGKSFITTLTDCYRRDLENMTAEDYCTGGIYGYLCDIPIWNACTETIELIESKSYRSIKVSERYNFVDESNWMDDSGVSSQTLDIRIYAPGKYETGADVYKAHAGNELFVKMDGLTYFDTYYTSIASTFEENYPDMYALLEAASADYISAEDCYMLVVNGSNYVIPPEASELAEAIIEQGNNSAQDQYYTDMDKIYDFDDVDVDMRSYYEDYNTGLTFTYDTQY